MTDKDPLSHIRAVIDAFGEGQMVIVTDDDDRENEGDIIFAAVHATPEKLAFTIRHTSGIVCAPLTSAEAKRLNLTPMVSNNDAPMQTAFTVSVDVRHGTTTGISAEERTATVRALANGNMGAGDFVRPGHVFPLIAKDGGVLMRSGHTEAAVDLCQLAKLPPVGVIAELVNDDGTVMRGPQVASFAQQHNLPVISVAELIAYRQSREKLVTRVAEFPVETEIGVLKGHAYITPFDAVHHIALVHGDISSGRNIPVRLHRADALRDVFGGARTIQESFAHFARNGSGVLVYLRDGTAGVPVTPLKESGTAARRDEEWHEVGLGAQILRDLGVSSIRLLASKERHYVGLAGFGIEIQATEKLEG